ncbi:MAG: Polyphosphate--glucose phosphotransferase [Frankiales bacterium]|nr:Polyphosphate--glucose phosphotransferase [Frankiales bacterium]
MFGLDIGGTGIKGAPVDPGTGTLTGDRIRVMTPRPATPEAVARTCADVVQQAGYSGLLGATYPGVVKAGRALTAANVDGEWIGTDIEALLSGATGCDVVAVNDADAAGLAEVRFGAGRNQPGIVVVVTFGTGIGTGVFLNGALVPNTELGHLEIGGVDFEHFAADSAREREDLSWEVWAKERVSTYLSHLEALLWPDLIVIGGGVSKKSEKWLPFVTVRTPVVAAALQNSAGIVGAALFAQEQRGDRAI